MFITALDFVTALELPAAALLEAAQRNGCAAAGILVQPYAHFPFPDPGLIGDAPACRALASASRDLGVAIDMADVFVLDPGCDVAALRPAFEAVVAIGAAAVNTLALDGDMVRLGDAYGKFCEMAAEFGVSVLAEVIRGTPLNSITTAVGFFDRLALPVKIEVDALHFFRYGGDVAEIIKYRDRIGRAQICDGPPAASDAEYVMEALYCRQIPGDGALPLVEFLAALPQGIVVGVEVPRTQYRTADRIARAVGGFRRLVERVGE